MDVTKDQVIGEISTNVSAHIGHINPFVIVGIITGFYYLNMRYYDPEIRRFINMDNPELVSQLVQTPGQLNMYAYCNNNPVAFTDESGEGVITLFLIGFLISAGFSALLDFQAGQDIQTILRNAFINGLAGGFSAGFSFGFLGSAMIGAASSIICDLAAGKEVNLAKATACGVLSGAFGGLSKGISNAAMREMSIQEGKIFEVVFAYVGGLVFGSEQYVGNYIINKIFPDDNANYGAKLMLNEQIYKVHLDAESFYLIRF